MMNELGYCSGIENYSRYLSGRRPRNRRRRCLTTCRPMVCWPSMSPITIPQIGGMYRGDQGAKRRWWSTVSACRLRSITVLKFEEFEALAPRTIYVGDAGAFRAG